MRQTNRQTENIVVAIKLPPLADTKEGAGHGPRKT